MLFGTTPFTGKNEYLLMLNILHETLEVPEGIPDALLDLFDGLFDKNPRTRITMDQIFVHPWVTKNGVEPLVQLTAETVNITEKDIDSAVMSVDRMMLLIKIKRRLSAQAKLARYEQYSIPYSDGFFYLLRYEYS
jgi:hypothetical protein